jgi:hypothetical protein
MDTGTYLGVNFSPSSVAMVQRYMKDNKIPNPVKAQKIHSTVIYSRKFLPNLKPITRFQHDLIAKFDEFVVWKTTPPEGSTQEPWNCLVMKLTCPGLVSLHNQYMKEHGATYDYDQYSPHLTLSYNIGDFDIKHLPVLTDNIEIIGEYVEDLDLDWAAATGTKIISNVL